MKVFRCFLMFFLLLSVAAAFAHKEPTTLADVCVGPEIVTINLTRADSGVTLLDEDKNGMTVRMDIGSIEFLPVTTREGKFILPRIDSFSRSFKVGEPTLPIASRLIDIPFDCSLKVQVKDSTSQDIDLDAYDLVDPFMPVQPPLSKSQHPGSVPFEYNRSLYAAGGKYALDLASARILGTMRSVRLAKIAVSPIEYYADENKITVYTSVTLRIKYKNPNWNKTDKIKKKHKSPAFDGLNNQLLNGESRAQEDDLVKYPIKYAIVADRMFESQLATFIAWKTKKGFTVEVGYTDTIGSTTTSIKNWLEGLYNAGTTEDPAPSFVLFVGDAQQIPAWSGSAGSHITDLRYCEFTGDDFPEIYYGRFSAQNTSHLQPQIDKTLEYEQYTMPDPSYLGEVTLVSGVDSGYADPYGNGQINYGTNLYFNASHGISPHVWLYPASDGSGVPADVRQTVNDGVGFYNYTAHCSHTGPADPSFTTSDIPNLTNAHKYLLGIGNCCLSNTFGTNYSTDCFGEAWLKAENKGGIGWIGGTNSTYWDEDYWFGVGSGPIDGDGPSYSETGIGAYDGVFHDHGEPVTRHYTSNGGIIFAGNMAVTEAGSSRTQYYWEIYHLMGDPSVMTYMGVPDNNSISHPSSITTSDTSVTVQADPGSYAGISRNGVLHGAGYIDTSGSATITITPFGSEGNADIVVTCQNRVPYTSTVSVTGGTTPPTAGFVGSPTSGMVPLTVNFTDQSTGATSWSWDFGDTGTSTQQSPSHTYNSAGTYTVSLTVTNDYGSDTETRTDYITVTALQPPVADFSASTTTVTVGQSVNFTDQSTNNPTSWSWTFDGGSPAGSTAQNPSVTYNTAGTYTVSLTAANAAGSDTETKTDYITVTLEYCDSQGNNYSYEYISNVTVDSFSNDSGGSNYTDYTYLTAYLTAGDTVNVSLTPEFPGSTYTEYWKIWIDYNIDGDFEDTGEEVFSGSGSSTVSGSFTVASGIDVTTRMRVSMKYSGAPTSCETFTYGEVEDYTVDISGGAPQPPVAAFTANTTSVTVGSSVNFTDQSTNNPTSWSWSFQGGTPSSSTSQNPTVRYNTAGTYDVTLTATNSAGSDNETKYDYITVNAAPQPPVAAFTASTTTVTAGGSVSFTDQSTNSPTSWSWSFEGGTPSTSSSQNPTVQYNTVGTYDVSLTAYNASGSDDEVKYDYITVNPASGDEIAEAVDYTSLSFTMSGSADWSKVTDVYYYGGDSAKSGTITHNQSTTIETNVTVGSTQAVKFYWRVSSENNYDYLRFYIDDVEKTNICGTVDWTQVSYNIGAGTHTLKWSYTKDYSVSSGSDCGWVDKLEITDPAADPIAEAVDYPGLTFTLSGDADWFSQTTTTYYGGDAAQSGDIGNSDTSTMETTISGVTSVKFYWRVSSETNYDYLRFYIDGVQQHRISGSTSWAQRTYTVSSGTHTLKWSFTKDYSVSSGSDCGWVDKLEFQ
ncbi:MAG: PKD domain-containing protein [Candidatus Aminicenantes bacterium]